MTDQHPAGTAAGTDVEVRGHAPAAALSVAPGQDRWTGQQRAALAQLGVDEAGDGDLAVFLHYSQRTGLDPFARQIYMVGRRDRKTGVKRWTIQTSIDGLRVVAQRSGDYLGPTEPQWCGPDGAWRDVWLPDRPPSAARIGVRRRGFLEPVYAVAVFAEYAEYTTDRDGQRRLAAMWASKPSLMIAKCAEALALRKAFPHDLSGLYADDEMGAADRAADGSYTVTDARAPRPAGPDPEAPALPAGARAWDAGPTRGPGTRGAAADRADARARAAAPPTDAQQRLMHGLLRRVGFAERMDALSLAQAVVGRHVTSSASLTRAEASRLIDVLKVMEADDSERDRWGHAALEVQGTWQDVEEAVAEVRARQARAAQDADAVPDEGDGAVDAEVVDVDVATGEVVA